MEFSNDTKIYPEISETSIPVIHGKNYYIDEQGSVCTYVNAQQNVYKSDGTPVDVESIKPVTEFIYIINKFLAYKTNTGFLVTDVAADKEKYIGGFQGIVGFDSASTSYQYLNNRTPAKSEIKLTARLNSSRQLELKIGDTYVTPLGEFRCYINNDFYNVTYTSVFPLSFGTEFEVTLCSWTTVTRDLTSDYIKDIFIQGNTLYLSTRLNIIGSTPYDWSSIDTSISTVVWSEDSRFNGGIFAGNPSASNFYIINKNTSTIYYVSGADLTVLQEFQHRLPILGIGIIDKYMLAIVDKEAISILSAYVSLNTWLIKVKNYFKFNQLSAYEEMQIQYTDETVTYTQDISSIFIKSTQRAPMIIRVLSDKVVSGCHTDDEVVAGQFSSYYIQNKKLYKIKTVEDSGEYTELDIENGIIDFNSFIYIGSDLEPDVGGSTMRDTEILFEGKISIIDGDEVSVESSGDTPKFEDLPVRTNQVNPENKWFLYAKTLRYPVSYTDWFKISMMPTTKIYNISLVADPTQKQKGSKK